MKTISLFTYCIIFVFTSCKKTDIAPDIPPCVYKEVAENKNNADWSTGSVEEYLFQNKTVYAFNPDNTIIADGATIIKDSNCNMLCSVGGFGGPSVNMCNGEIFFQVAALKRTIWTKNNAPYQRGIIKILQYFFTFLQVCNRFIFWYQ